MKRLVLSVLMLIAFTVCIKAQNVTLRGKTFTTVKDSTSHKSQSVKTDYVYVDIDNNTYPVYLSKNGKAYILRISKKTGKKWRKDLPEVTKMFEEMNHK